MINYLKFNFHYMIIIFYTNIIPYVITIPMYLYYFLCISTIPPSNLNILNKYFDLKVNIYMIDIVIL